MKPYSFLRLKLMNRNGIGIALHGDETFE